MKFPSLVVAAIAGSSEASTIGQQTATSDAPPKLAASISEAEPIDVRADDKSGAAKLEAVLAASNSRAEHEAEPLVAGAESKDVVQSEVKAVDGSSEASTIGKILERFQQKTATATSDAPPKLAASISEAEPIDVAQSPTPCPGGWVEMEVEVTTDDYPDETQWMITNSSGETILKEGPYGDKRELYRADTCAAPDDYTFMITDSYGDGMCCDYGNGGYVIKVNGSECARGGKFGDSDTKIWTLGCRSA